LRPGEDARQKCAQGGGVLRSFSHTRTSSPNSRRRVR
jgi:hypothetical protein